MVINGVMLEGIISFTKHLQDLLCVRLITCKYLVDVKQIYSLQNGPTGGNETNEKRLCFTFLSITNRAAYFLSLEETQWDLVL